MAPPVKTSSAMSALPGYFQMRQPRAADMQPSPPQSSGFSAPSATESAFHVLASNPPDVTKSATFSTPSNKGIVGQARSPIAPMAGFQLAPVYSGGGTQPAGGASTTQFGQTRAKSSTQPAAAYPSAGDSVPKGGKGGTGFVGFEQYFGANAPAARAQAERQARAVGQAVEAKAREAAALPGAYGYEQGYNIAKQGLDQFRQGQGVGTPSSGFDAMLTARAAPEAAAAEQARLNRLADYFGAAQQAYDDVLGRQRMADAANEAQRRFYEQQQAGGYGSEQEPSEQYANVPEEYDDVGYDGY